MPNWCNNDLTVRGNPEYLKKLSDAAAEGTLFQFIKPMPEALRDTVKGSGEEKQEVFVDGVNNWYDWCVNNWSTKWDNSEAYSNELVSDDELVLSFDTAWSPPIGVYEALLDKDEVEEVYATYYESGMDFAGIWDNGDDQFMEDLTQYFRVTPEGEGDSLAEEIDSIYNIRESIAMWDEENEDVQVD